MTAVVRLLAVVLLMVAAPAAATTARAEEPERPVRAEARTEPETITVGDRMRLTVVLRGSPGVVFEPPAIPETLGVFEILDQRISAPQRTPDGGALLRLELTVTAFQTGALTIPGLAVLYTDPLGERASVLTPDLPVVVRSVLGNDPNPQLLDLKPPLTIPGQAVSYTRSAATAMMIAGALALTVLLLRRRRPRPVPVPVRAVRPAFSPEAAALAELNDIEDAGLLARGDYATYYRRIAHCLRVYLEQRHRIPALSLTTDELRAAVARGGVDRWQSRVLIGIIEECDAVRWAGYAPAPARAARALIQAYEVVSLTPAEPVQVAP